MPIPFLFGGGGAASIINAAPGIVARFDANTGITSSGGFASQWSDWSGNARHLLQATGANQPVHLPAGVNNAGTAQAGSTGTTLNLAASALAFNDAYNAMTVTLTGGTGEGQTRTITDYVGATKVATVAAWDVTPDDTTTYSISATRASLLFDGAAHSMSTGAFTLNQPCSFYVVYKPVTWTLNDIIFDSVGRLLVLETGVTPQISMYAGSTVATNGDATVGATTVLNAVFNGANSLLQVKNNAATTGNPGAGNAGSIVLAGGTPQYSNIQVYEFLAYNVAHTAAQRAAVIAALMSKWGVA